MSQQVKTFSITAPGFLGLNTQDSSVDLDPKFALEANNCVIDKFGRVGSRNGWTASNTTAAALGSASIGALGELIDSSGATTLLAAGNNKLFKLVGTTLTELTYGGGGAAPTITADNWQTCTLQNCILFFQIGYDPLIYDTATSTTTYRRLSEHATYSGAVPLANCAISAYGRIWAANTTADKNTVTWSDTLTFQKWTGGTAGSLNLYGVWPQGGDEIVALAAHNNYLIIFGSKQLLIYSGAQDPATMTLSDAISNAGIVGRDCAQNTPDDLAYLSPGGLRSLKRTIQEKSAPITTLSKNVNDDITGYASNETTGATIKSVYSPKDSFLLFTFVESEITYCFDTRSPLQDGSYRSTTWSGITPTCYCYSITNRLYFGHPSYIALLSGYLDNGTSYRMSYYTSWVDFGEPIRTSILKKLAVTIFGSLSQVFTYKWGFDYLGKTRSEQTSLGVTYNIAEYNIGEYGIAEYNQGTIVDIVTTNVGGAGKVIQAGIEAEISGSQISVQRFDIYTKDGAYK